ncbi:MAG: hypothetical protein IAE94_03560 [Chthoniobacterales bacterium]|nr:hypothetical protein [Chthoniobacterales bacterium]
MRLPLLLGLLLAVRPLFAADIEVGSLAELADAAAQSGRQIRLKPGLYQMADYLTEPVLQKIRTDRAAIKEGRPPVPMFVFTGSNNTIDCTGATIEIDTSLYKKLPDGYRRSLIVAGSGNTIAGLSIRHSGPNAGSGGNTLSLAGERTTLEDVTVHVYGSWPFGYGDLLGKGGPNLVSIQKQSGIQVLGSGSILRRCRVFSRALGHCFYIQQGGEIRLEDCYAEGVMRATSDMLRDTSGPAHDLGFRSVYQNRDGRFAIVPGYVKSLVEDGFRTYGNAGRVTLLNCTAINTRAGFEIGAKDDAPEKAVLENCVARGCERAYLIGSQTIVRRSRGDIAHGPLLYLRGGRDSDVELELSGDGPLSQVHAVATIAGENHRVRLSAQTGERPIPALPILFGFGMPEHAEMASPILPAPTRNVTLINEIAAAPVITSDLVFDEKIESASRTISDAELRVSPGSWGLPANGVAPGPKK